MLICQFSYTVKNNSFFSHFFPRDVPPQTHLTVFCPPFFTIPPLLHRYIYPPSPKMLAFLFLVLCVVSSAGQGELGGGTTTPSPSPLPPSPAPESLSPSSDGCTSPQFCVRDAQCCGGEECSGRGRCETVLPTVVYIILTVIAIVVLCCCVGCGATFGRRAYRAPHADNVTTHHPREPYADDTPKERKNLTALNVGFGEDISCAEPTHMVCPISLQLMRDPVFCGCPGMHTFERSCLVAALQERGECPLSREVTSLENIAENTALKESIAAHVAQWREQQQRKKESEREMSETGGEMEAC